MSSSECDNALKGLTGGAALQEEGHKLWLERDDSVHAHSWLRTRAR